jgi:Domain of unknown function (DUF3291)
LVAITRLRLRSIRYLPAFVWYAQRSAHQARKSSGNLGVALRKTTGLTFWTLSVWQSDGDTAAYRRAPPHRDAMPKLQHWCDEASVAHWEQEGADMPAWDAATTRLGAAGKSLHVLHPSENHRAGVLGHE